MSARLGEIVISTLSFPNPAGSVVESTAESLHIAAIPLPLAGKLPVLIQESPLDRRVFGFFACAAIIAYALAMHVYWSPAHCGVDQNGYLVGGKFFAQTWSTGFKPGDRYSFVSRMWVEAEKIIFRKWPGQIV